MSCWYIASNCSSRPQSTCSSRSSSPCSRPTSPYYCCYVPSCCFPCPPCSPCPTLECLPPKRREKISDFASGGGAPPSDSKDRLKKGKGGKGHKGGKGEKSGRQGKGGGKVKGGKGKNKSEGGGDKKPGGDGNNKKRNEKGDAEATDKPSKQQDVGGKEPEQPQGSEGATKEGTTTSPDAVKPDQTLTNSMCTPRQPLGTLGICPNPYCPSNLRKQRPPPMKCYCKRNKPPKYEICPKCGKKKRPKTQKACRNPLPVTTALLKSAHVMKL